MSLKLKNGKTVHLGRIQPVAAFDSHNGRFRTIIHHDGSITVAPKLSYHYDVKKDIAPPPLKTNWMAKMGKVYPQTYGNTQEGDCVIASSLHRIGGWTANETGIAALSSDAEALQTYQTICGPGDNGCVITNVLDYAKAKGIPVNGKLHKIDGYVAIDPSHIRMLRVAIEVFGPAVNIGINIPQSWVDAANNGNGFTWDDTNDGSVGGHDVPIVDNAGRNGFTLLTWGMYGTITNAALRNSNIVTECYCSLSPDWYSKGNLAPNGINVSTLKADLGLLSNIKNRRKYISTTITSPHGDSFALPQGWNATSFH